MSPMKVNTLTTTAEVVQKSMNSVLILNKRAEGEVSNSFIIFKDLFLNRVLFPGFEQAIYVRKCGVEC